MRICFDHLDSVGSRALSGCDLGVSQGPGCILHFAPRQPRGLEPVETAACRNGFVSLCRQTLSLSKGEPNPTGFTLIAMIHLESLGSTITKIRNLLHETGAAVADFSESSYTIHSCPESAGRQNVSKSGRIGLIRLDSLGFTRRANWAFSTKRLKGPEYPNFDPSLDLLRSRACGTAIHDPTLFGLIALIQSDWSAGICFPVSALRFPVSATFALIRSMNRANAPLHLHPYRLGRTGLITWIQSDWVSHIGFPLPARIATRSVAGGSGLDKGSLTS
jgi:hypothetical protein